MNDDNRYEFGYDNRIIILKSLLERHLKDTHNPHQVSFEQLTDKGIIDQKIESSVYSIEAKFDENEQFCLYLYDYDNKDSHEHTLCDPIPIAAGTIADWATLLGEPTDNMAIRPYLYRIDLESNGMGYSIIPDFNNGNYSFYGNGEYDLATLSFENEDILYDDENVTIKTYTTYMSFGKAIEVNYKGDNSIAYYYFNNYMTGKAAWYYIDELQLQGWIEYDLPLTFELNNDDIVFGKEEILSNIIYPIVEGE